MLTCSLISTPRTDPISCIASPTLRSAAPDEMSSHTNCLASGVYWPLRIIQKVAGRAFRISAIHFLSADFAAVSCLHLFQRTTWHWFRSFSEVFTLLHEFLWILSGKSEFHGISMESNWLEPQPFWFPIPWKFRLFSKEFQQKWSESWSLPE